MFKTICKILSIPVRAKLEVLTTHLPNPHVRYTYSENCLSFTFPSAYMQWTVLQ